MSDCTVFANCFEIEYVAGSVELRPAIDPSAENGLCCLSDSAPGLWDPDEQCAVFCNEINTAFSGTFDQSSVVDLPIFTVLTVTNPSATQIANVFWAWYSEYVTISADPGVRGTVVTRSALFPNPLVDVGYAMYGNPWSEVSAQTVPGASQGFNDCPTQLAPGASATRVWAYRFEGAGNPGSWLAQVGALNASALVLTAPSADCPTPGGGG